MIFFNSDEPEPFDDNYYHFSEIYPEKKERNDQKISVPVINIRLHFGEVCHLFFVHINEQEEIHLDVSQYHYDELLEFIALEEFLQELINNGRIPPNAIFRIY